MRKGFLKVELLNTVIMNTVIMNTGLKASAVSFAINSNRAKRSGRKKKNPNLTYSVELYKKRTNLHISH